MSCKLTTRDSRTNRQFKPQIYQCKKGDRVEMFMICIILIEDSLKIGIDKIVETGEFSLVDKVEGDLGMNRIIGIIIGEEILEVM